MSRPKTRRPIRQPAPTIRLVSNARSSARVPYQMTGGYDNANTRTDIYSVGGYPDTVAFSDLWTAYRRKPLATAIINLPVKMCWQTPPKIECDDAQFTADDSHKHDDIVDNTMDAVSHAFIKGSSLLEALYSRR